jgi:hypothetical protein
MEPKAEINDLKEIKFSVNHTLKNGEQVIFTCVMNRLRKIILLKFEANLSETKTLVNSL